MNFVKQLKLPAKDGKYRETDCTTIEGLFKLIPDIPSKKVDFIKRHFFQEGFNAMFKEVIKVGKIEGYLNKGYSIDWSITRVNGIEERRSFTDVLKECGFIEGYHYFHATNCVHKAVFGVSTKVHKEVKRLNSKANLRDNLTYTELDYLEMAENLIAQALKMAKPQGFKETYSIVQKMCACIKQFPKK